jgi:hypothetical protein
VALSQAKCGLLFKTARFRRFRRFILAHWYHLARTVQPDIAESQVVDPAANDDFYSDYIPPDD